METCKSQSQAKYGPQELKLQKKIREKSSNLFGIFFIKILKHEIFWDGVELMVIIDYNTKPKFGHSQIGQCQNLDKTMFV